MEEIKETTLEQLFEEIENVIKTLENKNATLEQSFQAYEKGVAYLRMCNEKIDTIEKKMMVVNGEGGLDVF